jgi:two-component system chemotaxis response regulator CheY
MVDPEIPILVVDDSVTTRSLVRRLLKQLGFRDVHCAADALAAFQFLNRKGFRLIISDWHMEPVTGLEMLKSLRSCEKLKEIPVILMSADPTLTHIVEAKIAGANGLLLKPFSVNALMAKVEQAFQPVPA